MEPHQPCHLGMARTFQIVRSFPKMSARDNVKVGVVFGENNIKTRSNAPKNYWILSVFPWPKTVRMDNLNTVQLKQVEFARALATRCQLLLLDEAAAGLTPSEIPDFISLIKRIRASGVTIITIEHVMKLDHGSLRPDCRDPVRKSRSPKEP